MVRAIDVVSRVLKEHVSKVVELRETRHIKDKAQWEECRKLVDEVKKNFLDIVEIELRKKLAENPEFNKNMHLKIMTIPEAVIEEHIITGGHISIRSSKVSMLQELVDLAKKEGLEPFINHWDSDTSGKKYDAAFEITIPDELIQEIFKSIYKT